MTAENIPAPLVRVPQWVCWRYEQEAGRSKPAKTPYDPVAGRRVDVTKSAGLNPFGVVYERYTHSVGYDGIGYVLTRQDGVVGVDIDGCVDAYGQLSPLAEEVIALLNSYSELSPSGHGIRIFATADLGDFAGRRRGSIELYHFNRYLTVTGRHIPGTPQALTPRLAELREFYRRHLGPQEPKTPVPEHVLPPAAPDDEVLARMFAGKLGWLYHEIYHGETGNVYGRAQGQGPDESRADTLLINALAFYTGRDAEQMRRILLASPRARQRLDKWMKRVRGSEVYLDYQIDDSIRYSQRKK